MPFFKCHFSNVILPNVILPNVILPNVIMPNVIMPFVIMPNDIIPIVIMLNVVSPKQLSFVKKGKCRRGSRRQKRMKFLKSGFY
jgi:hypothetical protein